MDFEEFSNRSALSNLYWAIEGIEAAVHAKRPEERVSRLLDAERMLQVPALLDGNVVTTGAENGRLISASYFFLSVVKSCRRTTGRWLCTSSRRSWFRRGCSGGRTYSSSSSHR